MRWHSTWHYWGRGSVEFPIVGRVGGAVAELFMDIRKNNRILTKKYLLIIEEGALEQCNGA